MRRVVLTGAGTVNALAVDVPGTLAALAAGRTAIGPLDFPDVDRLAIRIGAGAQGFADLFDAGFLGRDEGKAICPDHRTRLADEPLANGDAGADAGALQDQRARTDLRAFGDGDMAGDAGARPDPHVAADGDKGADGRAFAKVDRGIHDGQRVYAGGDVGAWVHQPGQAGHGQPPARREDCRLQTHAAPVGTRPDDGGPRLAFGNAVAIARVHRQGQLVGPGRLRLGRAGNGKVQIALGHGPQGGGDLADRVTHVRSPGSSGSGLSCVQCPRPPRRC